MMRDSEEPCYIISVAARLVGIHAQTLRYYERMGIIRPSRAGVRRLYSEQDVARLRQVKRLIDDLGVNLAGVEVILRMGQRMLEMEQEIRRLEERLSQLGEAQERSPS